MENENQNNQPKKVLAFVDGYNLYDGCRKAWEEGRSALRPDSVVNNKYDCYGAFLQMMWYDPIKIVAHCGGFGEGCDFTVNFYTSRPKPSAGMHDPRHFDRYEGALRAIGVEPIQGEFAKRDRAMSDEARQIINDGLKEILDGYVKKRGVMVLKKFDAFLADKKFPFSVEKMTDVGLAVDIVKYAYLRTGADAVVLVSGDSDFDPVIKLFITNNPGAEFLVLLPPAPGAAKQGNRKKEIEKMMPGTDRKKFRVADISIEDIEKCPLSAKRKLLITDQERRRRYCGCQPGHCKWKDDR